MSNYSDAVTLEEHGQKMRKLHQEEYDEDLDDGDIPYATLWEQVSNELGIIINDKTAPILERFQSATLRQPHYHCFYQEEDGSQTKSNSLSIHLIHRQIK